MAPRVTSPTNPLRRGGWDRQRLILTLIVGSGCVLRFMGLGTPNLDFDESFTATAALLPFGPMMSFLTHHDSHPPLDYLLRAPFVVSHDTFTVRLPSAVFAGAALGLFAAWVGRTRGGVWAVALGAASYFSLLYAQLARGYALLMLAGVGAAWAASRWQDSPQRRWNAAIAFFLALAVFAHAGGLFLAAAACMAVGFRRDRSAWRWRASCTAPVVLWSAVWGAAFWQQRNNATATWIPATSFSGVVQVIGELTTGYAALWAVATTAVILGLFVLYRQDAVPRVVLSSFVLVPFGLVAAIGIVQPILLSRTLAFLWWVPPLALVALTREGFRIHRALGVVATLVTAILVLPGSAVLVVAEQPSPEARAVAAVHDRAEPGDLVAIHPAWLSPMIRWSFSDEGVAVLPGRSLAADDLVANGPAVGLSEQAFVLRVGAEPSTRRLWLIIPDTYREPVTLSECAPEQQFEYFRVRCLVTGTEQTFETGVS